MCCDVAPPPVACALSSVWCGVFGVECLVLLSRWPDVCACLLLSRLLLPLGSNAVTCPLYSLPALFTVTWPGLSLSDVASLLFLSLDSLGACVRYEAAAASAAAPTPL